MTEQTTVSRFLCGMFVFTVALAVTVLIILTILNIFTNDGVDITPIQEHADQVTELSPVQLEKIRVPIYVYDKENLQYDGEVTQEWTDPMPTQGSGILLSPDQVSQAQVKQPSVAQCLFQNCNRANTVTIMGPESDIWLTIEYVCENAKIIATNEPVVTKVGNTWEIRLR